MKSSAATHADESGLRAYAMSFPGAYEDHPWGESAFKVKGKVFLFVYVHAEGLNASMKLPVSNEHALAQPFAEPTGYGLGKSGWVTCKFERRARVPMEQMKAWIVESYRSVAPAKLVATLDGVPAEAVATTATTAAKPTATAEAPRKPVRRGAAGAPERSTTATPKPRAKRKTTSPVARTTARKRS